MKTNPFNVLTVTLLAIAWMASARSAPLSLIRSFEAIPYNGIAFPDPVIAAGPNSLVAMVNWKITVFNKQGTKLFDQSLNGSNGFWKAQGAPSSAAEPWVLYDPNSGRFIASAVDHGTTKGYVYLAISKTATPLSSSDWHKYRINRSGTHQGAGFAGVATYPDSAKVGVDGDAVYVTSGHWAKNLNVTTQFSHSEIFALAKAPLLSGGGLQLVYNEPVMTNPNTHLLHPAIVFEPAPAMYFVQARTNGPDDKIAVHFLSGMPGALVRTVAEVAVAPFDLPPNVPQLGSAALLQNIDARLTSATVRNGSLWTAHAVCDPYVDAESLVRWYQFDLVSFPGAAAMAQSGNVDPGPSVHAWLPNIGVDAAGNMGLGLSIGGPNQFAAIGYTGRLANDLPGSTMPVETARIGESHAAATWDGLVSWGEYSGLAIDPDGSTFWQFHEYPTISHQWNTIISAFQVEPPPPPADPLHCADLEGSGANQSGSKWRATVVARWHDGLENPVAGATVTIRWSTGTTASATTDASGRVTFTLSNLSRQSTSSVSLTITNAVHQTLTYNATANHDADGDSNGTSVTVARP